MNKLKFVTISIIMLLLLSMASPSMNVLAGPLALGTSPTLGAAGSFSVLGHTTVTNTGATTMPGDLGISIGGAPVGFPPGSVGPPGSIRNAADSLSAQTADTAAFGSLSQGCEFAGYQFGTGLVDLGGANLVPGVYCADSFGLTGTLTLNGVAGDVWIFRAASTLITASDAVVTGGDPCNVWWQVGSSATLGTRTSLIGNILALTSIDLQTGTNLNGRALAQTGAVTLDSNTITANACLTAPVSAPPTTVPEETTTTNNNKTTTTKVKALPNTGGAPIRDDSFPWSLALIGGIGTVALVLGVRKYLRTNKQ
jgi:hypothetical protein